MIRVEHQRSEHRGQPALIPDDLDMFVTTTALAVVTPHRESDTQPLPVLVEIHHPAADVPGGRATGRQATQPVVHRIVPRTTPPRWPVRRLVVGALIVVGLGVLLDVAVLVSSPAVGDQPRIPLVPASVVPPAAFTAAPATPPATTPPTTTAPTTTAPTTTGPTTTGPTTATAGRQPAATRRHRSGQQREHRRQDVGNGWNHPDPGDWYDFARRFGAP